MDVKRSSTRLATAAGCLAAAVVWTAPAEAQVSLRSEGGANALWAPVAPALLAEARMAGATVTRPTFLLEVRNEWRARPSTLSAESVTRFEPLDLTAELRPSPSAMTAPVTMLRQLPLSFGMGDVLGSFGSKRALHQVFPGLKSASRVFRLGGSFRF
jgi:hypothetical protein